MAMEDMVNGLLLTNKKEPPFCEGCLFGKVKKTPFPNKDVINSLSLSVCL
jgi:hypothetical protein